MAINADYEDIAEHYEHAQRELIRARRAAEVERRRQHGELLARAVDAVTRADWPGLREAASALMALDPDQARAFLAQAEARDKLYEEAVERANHGSWMEARLALRTVVKQWPADTAAADLLVRIEQARETAVRLAALYDEGAQAATDGRWEAAIAALENVLELDADYRDARRKAEDARSALVAAQEQAATQEQAARTAAMKTGELYLRAEDAMEVGDWRTAIICLETVIERDPGYADSTSRLVFARQQQSLEKTHISSKTQVTPRKPLKRRRAVLPAVIVAVILIVVVAVIVALVVIQGGA
jgi:outer membrane protein assembly factor BamD (BamD/ComL family)